MPRQQRLRGLGLLGHALHLLSQITEPLLLLFKFLRQLLARARPVEPPPFLLLRLCTETLGDFFLLLRQIACIRAHLPHLVLELPARLLAQVIAHFLKALLRSFSLGERARRLALLHGLRGLLRIVARLLELLALLGETRLVLRLFHLLLQLVRVREKLLFLLAKPLELPLRLLAFLLRLRLLDRVLQLLHALINVRLPLREFLQPVQDGELLLLLIILRLLGLALLLIPLLLVLHLQLIELRALLVPLLLPLALPLLLIPLHAKFMRREFQQRIVSRLLRRKRIGQRRGHLLRCREMPERALHLLRDCRRYRRGFRLLNFFRELLRHAKRFLLRILHHRLVLQIFFARRSRSRVVLRAFQIPRRGDDLLLQLRKLRRLTAPTAPTDTWRRLAAGTVVAGPVDFLEWPHLREENVALRTARLSVRSGVLGPHMPRHQLVHFHADLLELKHMLQVQFFVRLRIARERDLLRLATADGIADARRTQPEVIPRIHTERDLLDLRHTLVALRCHDLQFGPAVRQRIEGKCRGEFVCTTVGVLELQLPHRALADWKILQLHHSLCSIHTQRHHTSVLRDELCGLHRFVELKRHIKSRPLHRAHTSRIRDQLFRQLRKLREPNARICTI